MLDERKANDFSKLEKDIYELRSNMVNINSLSSNIAAVEDEMRQKSGLVEGLRNIKRNGKPQKPLIKLKPALIHTIPWLVISYLGFAFAGAILTAFLGFETFFDILSVVLCLGVTIYKFYEEYITYFISYKHDLKYYEEIKNMNLNQIEKEYKELKDQYRQLMSEYMKIERVVNALPSYIRDSYIYINSLKGWATPSTNSRDFYFGMIQYLFAHYDKFGLDKAGWDKVVDAGEEAYARLKALNDRTDSINLSNSNINTADKTETEPVVSEIKRTGPPVFDRKKLLGKYIYLNDSSNRVQVYEDGSIHDDEHGNIGYIEENGYIYINNRGHVGYISASGDIYYDDKGHVGWINDEGYIYSDGKLSSIGRATKP